MQHVICQNECLFVDHLAVHTICAVWHMGNHNGVQSGMTHFHHQQYFVASMCWVHQCRHARRRPFIASFRSWSVTIFFFFHETDKITRGKKKITILCCIGSNTLGICYVNRHLPVCFACLTSVRCAVMTIIHSFCSFTQFITWFLFFMFCIAIAIAILTVELL